MSAAKLKTVDVSGKSLKFDSESDIQPYIDEIALKCPADDLEKIVLSGNTIGIPAATSLANTLAKHSDLKVCLFNDIFTGRLRSEIPTCLERFTEALRDKKSLRELDLSDNAFGPDGLRPVVPLIGVCSSLQIVRVNNTGLGPQGGQLLAKALSQMGQTSSDVDGQAVSHLRTVVCGRSRLENGSMKDLADALKLHTGIRELVFPQDGIRPEGIVDLMDGLCLCRDLEILDLQDNTFTDVGAGALAKALPSWPRLVRLNVGDCMLTARGSSLLLEAMKIADLSQLEVLNLQYNEMNEKNALALAGILSRMPKLKSLELNGNCFSDDGAGADAIRGALEEMGIESALGSLSDMEDEDSDEEGEDEGEDETDDVAKAIAEL